MRKISQEDFIKRVEHKHGKEIEILGKYTNKRTKVLVKHKCGYEWEANPEALWNGRGCPICSGNIKKNIDQLKKEIFDLVGDEYDIIGEYINTHTPIMFRHNNCGNVFMMSPKSFIGGQRCPNERYIKSAKSNSIPFSIIKDRIQVLGKGDYEILGEYNKASDKVEFIHHACGNIFKLEPTRFIKGNIRCPHCCRSKGEEVIKDYLIKEGYCFKEQYKIKECKNIRPLPFDFAIFNSGRLVCLIEYDGSQHFSVKFSNNKDDFLKIKHNDNIKNIFCEENKIKLIRIKYVRSQNPNIFKEKVINKLKENFAINNMTIPSEAN